MKHLDHLLTQVAEPNNYKLKERAIYFSANFGKGWQAFFNFARHKLKYRYCCIESHLRTYIIIRRNIFNSKKLYFNLEAIR